MRLGARLPFLAASFTLLAFLWPASSPAKPVHILVTGDMHGWLEPEKEKGMTLGGAAEMLAYWKRVEHYNPKDFIVLSAGDIATGPAISTAFKGESVVEVMNAMGYDASALGNHEFDFGTDRLVLWKQEARFPFLCGNLLDNEGRQSALAKPYCLVEKGGVKVGILGLLTTEFAVAYGLTMTGYVQALRAWAPQARQGGAQVLVVLAHVPMDELLGTAAAVKDLGIPLMLGGHSHELGQIREPQSGTWVVHSWEWWKAYSRVDLDYDEATGRTRVERLSQVCLKQAKPEADPKVKAIVEKWRKALEKDYGKPLGFLSAPLTRPWGAGNFVTDAWLAMDPKADVAVCNQGGLRQDLKAGIVTKADLLGLMPFNDKLFHVKLTGRQLVDFLADTKEQEQRSPAGIRREGNGFVLMKTGKAVDPKAVYLLLTTDYMYDTSKALRAADPHPVKAGEDWRKLVEEWLIKHPTSKEQPLDKVVDTQPRM